MLRNVVFLITSDNPEWLVRPSGLPAGHVALVCEGPGQLLGWGKSRNLIFSPGNFTGDVFRQNAKESTYDAGERGEAHVALKKIGFREILVGGVPPPELLHLLSLETLKY